MPRPCTICARLDRARIDQRLALQVVNVSALARELGVGPDALQRHRQRHLPDFLPALMSSTEAVDVGTVRAEAQKLYLVTLDALAQAQAGVLMGLDADGTETRGVSMSQVARLIREARQGLDLLAKLSVASGGDDTTPHGVNAELDDRIARALERVADRAHPTLDVEDAIVVADAQRLDAPEPADPSAVPADTPGPGAASAPARARDLKESQAAQDQSEHDEGSHLRGITPTAVQGQIPALGPAEWKNHVERTWDGNPSASAEEKRAEGYRPIPLAYPEGTESPA